MALRQIGHGCTDVGYFLHAVFLLCPRRWCHLVATLLPCNVATLLALCDPISCSVCCRDRILAPGPHDDKGRLARNLAVSVVLLVLTAIDLVCHLPQRTSQQRTSARSYGVLASALIAVLFIGSALNWSTYGSETMYVGAIWYTEP